MLSVTTYVVSRGTGLPRRCWLFRTAAIEWDIGPLDFTDSLSEYKHTLTRVLPHTPLPSADCAVCSVWEMCHRTSPLEAVRSLWVWELQQFACWVGTGGFQAPPLPSTAWCSGTVHQIVDAVFLPACPAHKLGKTLHRAQRNSDFCWFSQREWVGCVTFNSLHRWLLL